jgi:membrane protein
MERVHGPTDLTPRAWWHALRDAAKRFRELDLTDAAATLTYYAVLSVFPFLIVLVSLLRLLGTEQSTDGMLRIADELGSGTGADTVVRPVVEDIAGGSGAAGWALVLGIAVGLWTASGYVGAFIRISNRIYGTDEDRPFWQLRPLQILITFVISIVIALVMTALFLTGPLAEAIANEVGLGDTARTTFGIARWPFLFAVVAFVIGLLYRFAPNVEHQGLRWVLPASALATVLWILLSAGFSLYVSNFASYSSTYGSLAGMIVFLIWLWLSNAAVVFGAQFGCELERTAAAVAVARSADQVAPLPDRR